MKPVEPNPTIALGDLVYLIPPDGGAPFRVTAGDFARHDLGRYRWYRGARGKAVASIESDRRTVYLARLLSGCAEGDRVALVTPEPFEIGDDMPASADYTPANFRVTRGDPT